MYMYDIDEQIEAATVIVTALNMNGGILADLPPNVKNAVVHHLRAQLNKLNERIDNMNGRRMYHVPAVKMA